MAEQETLKDIISVAEMLKLIKVTLNLDHLTWQMVTLHVHIRCSTTLEPQLSEPLGTRGDP